ncbi:MAG: PD40 domain-containing protein [Opitutales bacterium]|nr:PD40 domain-containing protein [Opitutales bacterium]
MNRKNFFCILLFGASSIFALAQHTIVIDGDAQHSNVPVYKVAITSSNAKLQQLAKRAFSTHGSYISVNQANAQFVFNFEQASANSVRVSVKGSRSTERIVSASNLVNALMKACDIAVESTLRSKGYFAGKLAFAYSKVGGGSSEIAVSDMVFQNIRIITKDKSDSMWPHFSPDGSRLAYTGYYRAGFMDLFMIDLNSNTRKTLASYKGSNCDGAMSPDGSKMAVILTSSGNAEIWVGNSQCKGLRKVTKTSSTESSVSFSPDGKRLIFASDVRGRPQVYTMPVSGGRMQVVSSRLSNYCSEPDWNWVNPDLVVFTIAQGRGFQVATYNMKTREAKVVSKGASTSGAKWLSDGRHIVCQKAFGKNRQLYIIDTETGRQTALHSKTLGSLTDPDFVYTSR